MMNVFRMLGFASIGSGAILAVFAFYSSIFLRSETATSLMAGQTMWDMALGTVLAFGGLYIAISSHEN